MWWGLLTRTEMKHSPFMSTYILINETHEWWSLIIILNNERNWTTLCDIVHHLRLWPSILQVGVHVIIVVFYKCFISFPKALKYRICYKTTENVIHLLLEATVIQISLQSYLMMDVLGFPLLSVRSLVEGRQVKNPL